MLPSVGRDIEVKERFDKKKKIIQYKNVQVIKNKMTKGNSIKQT